MKDQYTGDINDYRKYGLLRVIQDVTGLRLGINWLKTPNDTRSDGDFRYYLNHPQKFRTYDPPLFDGLASSIKTKNDRKIKNIIKIGILGDAISFDAIVPDDEGGRQEHLRHSRNSLRDSDIVFFDPDNGIEVKSIRYGRKASSKYVYLNELSDYYTHGSSLLIYQHFPRVTRKKFIKETIKNLRIHLHCSTVMAISSSFVVFFLVGNVKHELPYAKIRDTLSRNWNDQFNIEIHT